MREKQGKGKEERRGRKERGCRENGKEMKGKGGGDGKGEGALLC